MGNVQLIKQQVAELSRDEEEEEVGMDGRREKQVDISEEQEKKEGKMDRDKQDGRMNQRENDEMKKNK